jgi:hypothetical protein
VILIMKLVHRPITVLIICAIICVIITGCVVGGPKVWPNIEGVILDKDTGEPIVGVFVSVSYGGAYYYVIESQGVCYDENVIKTDEKGKFGIKTKFEFMNRALNRQMNIRTYKSGKRSISLPDYPSDSHTFYVHTFHMEKSSETSTERIKSIMRNSVGGGCGTNGKVSPVQHEMQAQGYAEALSLAKTKDELKLLRLLRYWIATSWNEKSESLSPNEAERIFSEKFKDLSEQTPREEKPVPQVIIIEQVEQDTRGAAPEQQR